MGDGLGFQVLAAHFQLRALLGAGHVNAHDRHGFLGELGIAGAGDDAHLLAVGKDLVAQIRKSKALDWLLEEARGTTDVATRQGLYLEIQKLLAEAAPWVWLYVGYEYRAMQPDVLGFTPLSNGSTVYLRETYLNR